MNYYIDAYNLIGKHPTIQLNNPDKENLCIAYIQSLSFKKNDRVFLIFDGYHDELGSRRQVHSLHIIFTENRQNADDYIAEQLKTKPKNSLLISSDKELQYRCKCIPHLNCEAFIKRFSTSQREEKPVQISSAEKNYWLKKWQSPS